MKNYDFGGSNNGPLGRMGEIMASRRRRIFIIATALFLSLFLMLHLSSKPSSVSSWTKFSHSKFTTHFKHIPDDSPRLTLDDVSTPLVV
jgi:hypothetical protein